jgi:hypothetical protein
MQDRLRHDCSTRLAAPAIATPVPAHDQVWRVPDDRLDMLAIPEACVMKRSSLPHQ